MVAMKERMQAVVTANKSRQSCARDLNIRAGSNLFPVLGQSEIVAWLAERLGNAVSMESVSDPEELQLPSLDEELVELVVRENPDEIQLLGQTFKVTHRNGYAPGISLEGDAVKQPIWRQLPDEGVLLPSGRAVIVSVKVGYWDSVSDSSISKLKEKVRKHLNFGQWSVWTKPEIAVPDITAEESKLPDIITSQYGKCVVEGTPLTAYGTLIVNSSRYYQNDPYFKTGWYQNKEEVTKSHDAAVTKLGEIKKEARERRELESTTKVAEALKDRLESLYGTLYHNNDVNRDLRERISNRRYSYLPSTLVELKTWITETEAIVAEADGASTEIDRRKAKRVAHEENVRALGYGLAHLLVSADDVAVNCGKSSKLGSFEVNPSAGERRYDGASLDNEGRYSTWQPIPCGQPVTCYDFSSQGNLKSEVTFAVQEGQLGTGVWAVVQDDRGVFFFPVIYYRDRTEIIPDSVTVVREEKCKSFSSNASGEVVSLIGFDPSKLFGGQARVLPTRNKKK